MDFILKKQGMYKFVIACYNSLRNNVKLQHERFNIWVKVKQGF